MTDPLVTLVVPAHGPASLLAPLLDSLADQVDGRVASVVVSDDASPVPLEPAIREQAGERLPLHVVRSERNGGPGAARNRGLALVDTPWVAFLDADTVPDRGWVARLLDVLADDDADVVEGRTVMGGGEPVTPFTHATEAAPPAQHVAGNVAFRTDVLRSAGGFDERFYDVGRKLHFREDAELAFRLEDAGARFRYDPALLVHHPPLPASFWSPVRLARRYYFDALLDRLHPERFRRLNRTRRIGPVSLRLARHLAAVAFVAGTVATIAGALTGLPVVLAAGVAVLLVAWVANAVALSWRRQVRPGHLLPLVAASALVPWVYLWHHWLGAVRFRHRPRL